MYIFVKIVYNIDAIYPLESKWEISSRERRRQAGKKKKEKVKKTGEICTDRYWCHSGSVTDLYGILTAVAAQKTDISGIFQGKRQTGAAAEDRQDGIGKRLFQRLGYQSVQGDRCQGTL